MSKKNTKKKQNKRKNKKFLIIGILFLLCIGLISTLLVQARKNESKPISNQSMDKESLTSEADQKAIMEAREIAEAYFKAANECDFDKANSYRLFPLSAIKNEKDCIRECPGGLRYKYVQKISYDNSEIDGVASESAIFLYYITCDATTNSSGMQTYDTRIQLIRTPDSKVWQVINTL